MTGFLYAIGNDEGRVKIGWSADPAKRRSEIASDLPGKIELLGVIAATHEQEAEAHQLFEPWRISGEWYRLEGAVAAFVAMLPKPVRPAPDPASLQILKCGSLALKARTPSRSESSSHFCAMSRRYARTVGSDAWRARPKHSTARSLNHSVFELIAKN
jgi:hypothetical protein